MARVDLSENRRCTLEFCRWYSGSCVLSCYQHDVCTGTVHLVSGLFEHPWAMFPGPDGNTAVCFSRLDTTYAAFTLEVTKSNNDPCFARLHLQAPAEPVLKRSDFLVRACTIKEVEFVRQYIQTADLDTLAKSLKGGVTAETRQNALIGVAWSTGVYGPHETVDKNAHPQVLP